MTEIFEHHVCDRNPINRALRVTDSGHRVTALFAVVAMFLGLVFASVQPASATPAASLVWTAQTAATASTWSSVTYGTVGGTGLFVAVSSSGTVMTSTDGTSWTAQTAAAASTWKSVTYGNGTFVAVADTGTLANRVMTSTNGTVWTAHSATATSAWFSVTYGTVGGTGLFVAVSTNGTVMTSPTGATWTAQTAAAANSWSAVTYGGGTFVAVAYSGDSRVMTSTDGIAWTAQTAAAANAWRSVTYGNDTFVAVATDGTVMTSPTGATWTAQTAAAANTWRSVTYGGGRFVAVADSGDIANRVMASTNGTVWTAQTAAAANAWRSVTYGNGIFVAVSLGGVNQVMTGVPPFSAAPTSLVATPGNGSVSIAFTPGADGGDAITKYQYQIGSGSWIDAPAGTSSPVVITDLTNGTPYSIKLRSYNGAGGGTPSDAVSVTPLATPDAPTSLVATPDNGSVSIAFTPGATGGDAITKYQYQIGSGSWTDVSSGGTSSPSSITGLTNGTEYSIRLRAYNGAGGGTPADAVSVTPRTTPSAPTDLVATPGNGSVSIAFTAGATGGAAISKYQYKIGSGSWIDAPAGTSSPVVITGLVNYVANSIKLRAYNAAGAGTASTALSVTTKISAPVIVTAYSAAQSGNANRGLYVGFTGVSSPGASMVSYRINVYAKGTNTVVATALLRPTDRGYFLGGLTTGTEYDIRVIGYFTLTSSPLITRGTLESATRTVRI